MTVQELASGIDALYLSGQVELEEAFVRDLDRHRDSARVASEPVPYRLGNFEFGLAPYGWGMYPYLLTSENGRIGFTGSKFLPSVRVQPKAEMLHGLGSEATVEAFSDVLSQVGEVEWLVGRVDLFADVQGWMPTVEQRDRFVSRARTRIIHEEADELNGMRFGSGKGQGLLARIYNKSKEAEAKGVTWWADVWGEAYRVGLPVTRVEFQFGRTILRQLGMDTPESVFKSRAGLWAYATDWLSYRDRTADATRSRWPIAAEWEAIRKASLRDRPITLTRTTSARTSATERRIIDGLCGYVSSLAAIRKVDSIEDALPFVAAALGSQEMRSGLPFADRVAKKRREWEWGL